MSNTENGAPNGTPNAAQPAPKAHKLDKHNPWRKVIILAVILVIAMRKLKWNPIAFLAISAVIGIVFRF